MKNKTDGSNHTKNYELVGKASKTINTFDIFTPNNPKKFISLLIEIKHKLHALSVN